MRVLRLLQLRNPSRLHVHLQFHRHPAGDRTRAMTEIMTGTASIGRSHKADADFAPILAFSAPYLIEKLIKERVVATAEEGLALFAEVRKYLLLSRLDRSTPWGMYSARVDAVWHHFVLFTQQYMDFCQTHFGEFMHHRPSNAPRGDGDGNGAPEPSTFEEFRTRYETVFGERLPDAWLDECAVTLSHRVLHDSAGKCRVTVADGMASLARSDGSIEIMVEDIAHEALEFIAGAGSFHVRELPGPLTDEEKVGLVAALVAHRQLRLAP